MTSTYVYLAIFACITYLIVTDESIAKAIYLICQISKFQFEKFKWWIRYSPDNPIVRYLMWRRAYKLAKELRDELESNAK